MSASGGHQSFALLYAEARQNLNALREEAAGMPEMTLDEINAEISAVRAARNSGEKA